MIIKSSKQAVIEYWNADRPGKIEILAAACMWDAGRRSVTRWQAAW